MLNLPEEFSAATKSHFEAQLAMITALTGKAFESVEKMVDLNLNVVKASMEESSASARQMLTAKDPQELIAMSAAQAQPGAEKAMAYGRHLASIASSTQVEFTKAAETQVADTNRKMMALIDELSKNAPAGSEQMITVLRSAIDNANAGYAQLTKTTKQAVETMESNMNNAVTQMSQVAEKTAGRGKK